MTTFAELGVRSDILQALESLGFTTPTPIQTKVIPAVLKEGLDLVGTAQTGTGKTAAFGIPLIQLSDARLFQTQALVLCPTRELCMQVATDLTALGRYVPGMKVVAVYGGASIDGQISALKMGAQIIVATPGRLHDLIRRRKVDISTIHRVVLDEADEMLKMGFKDELNAILAETPAAKNVLLFSATMPKQVAAIANKYMTRPVEITAGRRNSGADNIRHIYYMVQAKDRYQALKRIADFNPDIYSIVFCRTREETRAVADKLVQDGYNADALHGDLSQAQRDQVMKKFRHRSLQMLIATDVAARGLDVNDLTHVINYNLPDESANYTHRSGRTGRAGKDGISISLIHLRESYRIRELEKSLNVQFEQARIPTGAEICKKKLLHFLDRLLNTDIDQADTAAFLPAISSVLAGLDREELIQRFVTLEFDRFLKSYRHAPDLNISIKKNPERTTRDDRPTKFHKADSRHRFSRLLLNVGKRDGVNAMRLIGAINDALPHKVKVGKIEIMPTTTLLEADSKFTPQVQQALRQLMINGKPLSVEMAGERAVMPYKKENRQERKPPAMARLNRQKKITTKKKKVRQRDEG